MPEQGRQYQHGSKEIRKSNELETLWAIGKATPVK
jgi:hypothetical protein